MPNDMDNCRYSHGSNTFTARLRRGRAMLLFDHCNVYCFTVHGPRGVGRIRWGREQNYSMFNPLYFKPRAAFAVEEDQIDDHKVVQHPALGSFVSPSRAKSVLPESFLYMKLANPQAPCPRQGPSRFTGVLPVHETRHPTRVKVQPPYALRRAKPASRSHYVLRSPSCT